VAFKACDALAEVIDKHQQYIQQETLASSIVRHEDDSELSYAHVIDEASIELTIEVDSA
jgi:hypothetical protein